MRFVQPTADNWPIGFVVRKICRRSEWRESNVRVWKIKRNFSGKLMEWDAPEYGQAGAGPKKHSFVGWRQKNTPYRLLMQPTSSHASAPTKSEKTTSALVITPVSRPTTPTFEIRHGDNRELIKRLPDNSVDAIVTDPPYGLGNQPDAMAMLRDWVLTGHHKVKGSGFMDREWDAFVPQPAIWKECLRVLKPGGHLLAFGGTRTYDLVVLGVRIAGFEVRDQLQWVYGCGMPKVGYIKGKDGEHVVQGWGGALRPGYEPIVVARKPVAGTLRENLAVLRTGALNIDSCKIVGDEGSGPSRWPSNILHDGSPEVVAAFPEASGQLAPTRGDNAPMNNAVYGAMKHGASIKQPRKDASASAARFFYSAKASRNDRNEGLAGKNTHATVKPTELMRYLCRLVTPFGGTILDPFTGSGSTGKAAVLEGFDFIGFELKSEYVEIARARVAHAEKTRATEHLEAEGKMALGFIIEPAAAA